MQRLFDASDFYKSTKVNNDAINPNKVPTNNVKNNELVVKS